MQGEVDNDFLFGTINKFLTLLTFTKIFTWPGLNDRRHVQAKKSDGKN